MNLDRALQLAYDLRPSASEKAVRAALPLVNELAGIEGRHWKPRISRLREKAELIGSGGQFYQDMRPPWLTTDTAAVTLATTAKLLWPVLANTATFPSDWFEGKQIMVRAFGRITTPAGAGAVTTSVSFGTADNTGLIASSAANAVTASQTNISWRVEVRVRCREVAPAGGTNSDLLGTGIVESAVMTATTPTMIPASAAAPITNADLTAASQGIGLQMAMATTTGGTVTTHDLELVHNN